MRHSSAITEREAKWMIPTELKKGNERDKNPKHTQSLNSDRAQGRRAPKKTELEGNPNAWTPRDVRAHNVFDL